MKEATPQFMMPWFGSETDGRTANWLMTFKSPLEGMGLRWIRHLQSFKNKDEAYAKQTQLIKLAMKHRK